MVAHPLFRRPWSELRLIFWASYVLGPLLLTVLLTPLPELGQGASILRELLESTIATVCGLGLMHFLYAIVAPRVLATKQPLPLPRVIAAHVAILGIGMFLGAELTILIAPDSFERVTPLLIRMQYYRFTFVYAGFMIGVLAVFDRLRDQAITKERERELAAREAKIAQLEALQIRTNPHFLFNALNTVAYLVTADPKKAIESIERMSDLFRSILDFSSDMTVPLDAELDIVRGYLQIEALRYEALACNFAIAEDTRAIPVPPLIVQPIVENAIKHGVARNSRPGAIEVRTQRTDTHLSIFITNTEADDHSAKHNGAGRSVDLIRRRLSLAYGDDAKLEHGPDGAGGYLSALTIPLRSRARE